MTDLLPCPHCGGVAKILPHHYGSNARHFRVYCDTTGCTLGFSSNGDSDEAKRQVIAAWNRRAPLAAPAAAGVSVLVDALREVDGVIAQFQGDKPHLKLAYAHAVIQHALSSSPQPGAEAGGWVQIDEDASNLPGETEIVVWGYNGLPEADTYIGTMLDDGFDIDAWTHWHRLAPLPPPPQQQPQEKP